MLILDALGEIRLSHSMALIDEIRESGTNAVTVTLADPKTFGETASHEALEAVLAYDQHIAEHGDRFKKATCVRDIHDAVGANQLAIFYQFQNATPLHRDLEKLDLFYKLGVRSIQLTYNYQNYVGAGCRERDNRGLSAFGVELVERMNELGVLIDTSHACMATMADAIRSSREPIIISHTACQSVHQHVRNTTDENLRLLAEHGGVVGVCQIRPFLTERRAENLDAYFDHLDHAIRVAGEDHVCIGSDRDHRVIPDDPEEIRILQEEEGAQFQPEDWPLYISELNGPRRMEVVLDGLRKHGHSPRVVEKVAATNLLRLYQQIIG